MPAAEDLKPCSLFLVQYVPDPLRGESLNIGLFLHSADLKYLDCRFTDDFGRVKRFHAQADLELLRDLQQDFERQIDEHGDNPEAFLDEMRNSFSNAIQLAPARTCMLRDPEAEIEELFSRYVGARVGRAESQDTRLRVKQKLNSALARAGVWEKLQKRVAASRWTQPGDPFTFDYAYVPVHVASERDGHLRLIHALSLRRDTELAKVLVYTLEHVRRREPAGLTAVVEALPAQGDQSAGLSHRILEEARVAVQPVAGVGDFAESVRQELIV